MSELTRFWRKLLSWWGWLWDDTSWCPRTECGEWPEWLIKLHVWSDRAIWSAYIAIPCVIIVYMLLKRKRAPYPFVGLCFAVFIFSCGYGHYVESTMFVTPVYRWVGVIKCLTAIVSWWTVICLVHIMPKLLSLRTHQEYQEQLNHHTHSLQMAERNLRMMIESVKDFAIFSMDLHGLIVSWNTGAMRIFGWTEEEVLGAPVDVIFTNEDRTSGAPAQERLMALERGCGDDERWHLRKGGGRFFASGTVTPIKDEDEKVTGFTKVCRDITASKKAQDERDQYFSQLQAAKDAAESASRAKDQFLAILSHEMRTPLTPCLLTASSMAVDPETPEPCRRAFENIQRNLELEARLIDDLLDLMLISKGRMSFHMTVIDAHHKIELAANICRPDIVDKQITLKLDLRAHQRHITADAARFQQVIWNLIKNSVKFTPKGGTITVKTYNKGENLIVEVKDTGIGIMPEIMPSIFEAFVQAERSKARKYGGLGLGLSISKAIIEGHHGQLSVASEGADAGSVFTVTLQTTYVAVLAPPTFEDSEPEARLKVMYVEDDHATRTVMTTIMKAAGYEVHQAHSLETALALDANQFDILISDIGLGDGTGLDLMSQIRHDGIAIPGIALSGYGAEEDVQQSLRVGFAEHLTKPVVFPTLDAAIRRVVRR